MTIFYLDPVNGNDTNNGSSWALAWLTVGGGATAARIAPGDIIRVAKTPDPTLVGTAGWNNGLKTISLSSAVVATVDMGENAWTSADANVTCSQDSTNYKQGTSSAKMSIASGFTTGKIAYRAFTAANFAAYQQLSFWVSANNGTIQASMYKLCLCSDAAGNTIVDTFFIPAATSMGTWYRYTVDKGSAMGASIQSIALYLVSDQGGVDITLDCIIACKSKASADSLTLNSLVSKSSLATGGTEAWFAVRSITGTSIEIDDGGWAGTGRGYCGATESVNVYKRETVQVLYTGDLTIQDSGSAGNMIQFQGGYNTSNTTQDGETFFWGTLAFSSNNYVLTNRISAVLISMSCVGSSVTATNAVALSLSYASGNTINVNNLTYYNLNLITLMSTSIGNSITIGNLYSSMQHAIDMVNSHDNFFYITNCLNCGQTNVNLRNFCARNKFFISNCKQSAQYAVAFDVDCFENFFFNMTTASNTSGAIFPSYTGSGANYFVNCTLGEATKVATGNFTAYYEQKVILHKLGGVLTDNQVFLYGGIIKSQISVRHTASGMAWQMSPTNTDRSAYYPLSMSIRKVALAANSQVTITCFFQRSNVGISAQLMCRGSQIAGVASDVVATASASAGTWEQLSIQFTPTEAGVVEILALAWGGTTYSVYVDDMGILQ